MKAESIKTIAVIGGGLMGQGIAQNFAQSGLSVKVINQNKTILDQSLTQIRANLKLFEEYGLLEEDIPSIEARIHPVPIEDLVITVQDSDFVVEAIPENLELKKQLFNQLDSSSTEIILSSNSSSIPIQAITQGCRTQARMIGLHYFSPAHIMPLVEIHFSPQTSDEVVAATKALMLRVGKKPIIVKREVPGFVINRLQGAIAREITHLIGEGVVSIEDIEVAGRACFGFRWACIGFMESIDMIGLDVASASAGSFYKLLHSGTEIPPILTERVNRGELGVKTGKGFFDYTGKSVEEIVDNWNRRLLRQLAVFKELEAQLEDV